MADFEFSRDYRKLWKEAKEQNNIFRLDEIFEQIAYEAKIPDPTGDASSAAAGARIAELMNSRQTGTSFEGSVPGKKI